MLSTQIAQWTAMIKNTAPVQFWIYFIGAMIVAAIAFYFAFHYFKRARLIEDTPTSRIRSAAQGYVELQGRGALMDGPDIVAPYSKKACTWYRYKVEKLSEKHSRTLDSGCSDELFILQGETGRCVIDPEGAHVTPTVKKVWYSSSYPPNQLSHRSRGFLNSMGGRYRYTEERMHPGDPLYAIGWFKSVGGHNENFNTREDVRQLLAKWKADPNIMKKIDRNNDGEIDMQEWDNARKLARHKVKQQHARRSTQPPTHVMTRPADRTQPFLLSSMPQHHLTKRFRLYAGCCFAAFLISGALAVWMFNIRF